MPIDEPTGWRRVALSTKVSDLPEVLGTTRQIGGRVEHVYDY
jgi:hypothetical protein